jgi:hypothetical protein
MNKRWRTGLSAGIAAGLIFATGTLVFAQSKKRATAKPPAQTAKQAAKPMSVEEARRIATKTPTYTPASAFDRRHHQDSRSAQA